MSAERQYTFAITLTDAGRGTVEWECPHCHWKKAERKIEGRIVVCPSCQSEVEWTWAHRKTAARQ